MDKEQINATPDAVAIDLQSALEERYLAYALSTITQRALPDARDGLKPVQRRIIYAMRQLGLWPDRTPKKTARVVGEVIGRFHPHGEQSIYDALVRLAQEFSQRYPLLIGQGNFGNIDGDQAAAMRYTEARLSHVGRSLLEGLDDGAVDFRPTYDEQDREPVVLPAAFPQALANGVSGIAVGMATSVPPHNIIELVDAAMALIDDPELEPDALMAWVKGPDFATGGLITDGPDAIASAYRSGRGSFRVRARWHREPREHGQWQIVVSEIPFQVAKSKLIERIASLVLARKLPQLADVRDESTDDVRIILEPKSRNVSDVTLMEALFKRTELEQRFVLNINLLRDGKVPEVMGLKGALWSWLEHRRTVMVRLARQRTQIIERRLNIVKGLIVAIDDIDEVIGIIRFEDKPSEVLAERFALDEDQVNAILDMRLRVLHKLEAIALLDERKRLEQERGQLSKLTGSKSAQWNRLRKEISALRRHFLASPELSDRRTGFAEAPTGLESLVMRSLVEREPTTVIVSKQGWIRSLKGHGSDPHQVGFKEGDGLKFSIKCQTTDRLLALSDDGKVFTLACDTLPGGRGQGEPLRLMIDLPSSGDLVDLVVAQEEGLYLLASKSGRGFLVGGQDLLSRRRGGRQVLKSDATDPAFRLVPLPGIGDGRDKSASKAMAVLGDNRRMLIIPLDAVPRMSRGRGVILQRYKAGGLSDVTIVDLDDGLVWWDKAGRRYRVDAGPWVGRRASFGSHVPRGFPRNNRFDGKEKS